MRHAICNTSVLGSRERERQRERERERELRVREGAKNKMPEEMALGPLPHPTLVAGRHLDKIYINII